MLYQIYVDTQAFAGGQNEGEPPIIVRPVEQTAEGLVVVGHRTRHWRVDLPGPSAVVCNLGGEHPQVWVQAADVTPQPPD